MNQNAIFLDNNSASAFLSNGFPTALSGLYSVLLSTYFGRKVDFWAIFSNTLQEIIISCPIFHMLTYEPHEAEAEAMAMAALEFLDRESFPLLHSTTQCSRPILQPNHSFIL